MENAAAPEAVEIHIRAEIPVLRRESRIRGTGMGGVILALNGVAKQDDKLNGGVGMDSEVEVPTGHLVHLIDNKDARGLEKGRLPGAKTPFVLVARVHEGFPFITQFGGGDSELEDAESGSAEKMGDRPRFATAGKTGNVDQTNPAGSGDVETGVQH